VLARFQVGLPADSFTIDADQNNHLNLDVAALALTYKKKKGGNSRAS
jgi:hypothetical protein